MTDHNHESEAHSERILPSIHDDSVIDKECVNQQQMLDHLTSLEIYRWTYTDEQSSQITQFGPTTEEFSDLFGVDQVTPKDINAVALATIQELQKRIKQQQNRINRQQELVNEQRADLETLRERVESLQVELRQLQRGSED